jgi:hypothetical protein
MNADFYGWCTPLSFVVFFPICEFWDKFADKFGLTPLTGQAHPGYN